jgi:pimeloyl-ACP methyl ester carboxylesterase
VTALLYSALVGTAALVGVFLLICLLYVVVSFGLLWREVPPPAFGSRLRIMSRELVLAALVQPLLPLFYLVGRRMGGGAGQPVVLVHGYFQNRADFLGIVRVFRQKGLGPLFGFNYPWTDTTANNVARLALFVEKVCTETGHEKVDLVAHSMGGLICLEYVAEDRYTSRVRRCITIATPHAGVRWSGPLLGAPSREIRATSPFLIERKTRLVGVPCLSIFSPADNIVFPATTSALATRGGTDKEARASGHFSILFDAEVIEDAATFLQKPDVVVEAQVDAEVAAAETEALTDERLPGVDDADADESATRVDQLAR